MKSNVIILAAMLSGISTVSFAQRAEHSSSWLLTGAFKSTAVPFSVNTDISQCNIPDESVIWGMDVAWNWDVNVVRGTNYIGKENLKVGRVSFQPSDLVDANGNLSSEQKKTLDSRLTNIAKSGVKDIVLNCDHEVLCAEDSYPNANQNYANYYGKPQEWYKVIKATVKYCQAKGFNVITISPFNEPDYTDWKEGTQAHFKSIAQLLSEDEELNGIRISAGNTLNCDKALSWYNYMKPYVTEGNTHQLAGSMANYTKFWETVRSDGNHATADELHNTMEAFIGIHHGMQTGIWWGYEGATRGEFCKSSAHGKEIGYAENSGSWSGAAVYKREDGRIDAYLGTSERQAKNSTFNLVSTDRPVYYNGYGPTYSYSQYLPADPNGTYGSTLQKNAETMIGISYGEDVPMDYIRSGNFVIVNANSNYCLSYTTSSTTITQNNYRTYPSEKQYWTIETIADDLGGDFCYSTLRTPNSKDGRNLTTSEEWGLESGKGIKYAANWASAGRNHWFFEYAGDNSWYIRNRWTGLYLQPKDASTKTSAYIVMSEFTGNKEQKWRFIPVPSDPKATPQMETEAPAAPTGLIATPQSASIKLSWNANSDSDLEAYNVLRSSNAEANQWDMIGRLVKGTEFVDNDIKPGIQYSYKIKAVDHAHNQSEASSEVIASTKNEKALIAHYSFDSDSLDASENLLDPVMDGTVVFKKPNTGTKEGSGALYFNGTDTYAQLPASFGQMEEFTIAFWVNNNSYSTSWTRIFDFGNSESQYFFLCPYNGSEMRLVFKDNGDEQILKATRLGSGWHHIAVTISKSEVALYVDGKAYTSNTITIRPSDFTPKCNYIGRSQFPADPLFKGYLDDLRVYNFPVTQEDVSKIIAGEEITSSIEKVESGEWKMGNGKSDAYDISGKKINPETHKGIYIQNNHKEIGR